MTADPPLHPRSIFVFAKMDRLRIDMQAMVDVYLRRNGMRKGQAWFNALEDFEPELANIIRGTDEDPYNNDAKLPAFIKAIFGNAEFDY